MASCLRISTIESSTSAHQHNSQRDGVASPEHDEDPRCAHDPEEDTKGPERDDFRVRMRIHGELLVPVMVVANGVRGGETSTWRGSGEASKAAYLTESKNMREPRIIMAADAAQIATQMTL